MKPNTTSTKHVLVMFKNVLFEVITEIQQGTQEALTVNKHSYVI
jgi:hypothetical protein